MRQNRLFALTALFTALCLLLCACAMLEAPVSHPPVEAEPDPEPTPEIVGVEKVFGKDMITLAVTGCEDEDAPFYLGALAQAERLGMAVALSDDAANDADAALMYMPDEAPASGVSVIYTDKALSGTLISIDAAAPANVLAEAVLGYEAHEAPVRTILLADSEESPLYAAIAGEGGLGKFQLKAVHAGADGAVEALREGLENTMIGLLDTIIVENAAVALDAFNELKSANRSDTTEVMTLGVTPGVIEAMRQEHFLMGAAAGYNEYAAGALAVRMAALRLLGENVESCALEPLLLTSDDVLALDAQNGGALPPAQLMLALADEPKTEFGNEALDYLYSYYGSDN